MKCFSEAQVKELLSVEDCIGVLRRAFSMEFTNIPRYRLKSENSLLHVMSASIPALGVMGLKAYGTSKNGGNFAVLLFEETSGSLLAVFEADALGQIRTGAASGLATDLLANQDARVGAVIGTGYQAETQLLAIDAVREFREIRVFSRSADGRRAFLDSVRKKARAPLVEVGSAEECAREADVICTITSSKEPVLRGKWLKPGCHINAAGVNWANRRELDEAAIQRSDMIVVDHLEQSKRESGDLIAISGFDWTRVIELSDVVRRKIPRFSKDQITLFKSNGIAMEDVAAAHYVLSRSM